MFTIKNIRGYLNKNNIDIAFLIAMCGIIFSSFIEYAWVISILACLFIKEEEKQVDS